MVYVLEPPTWFEDGWSYYEVAPDGSAALFGARFGFELVDLERGRLDPVGYRGALDDISAAIFDEAGGLMRLGTMTGLRGWFVLPLQLDRRRTGWSDFVPRAGRLGAARS